MHFISEMVSLFKNSPSIIQCYIIVLCAHITWFGYSENVTVPNRPESRTIQPKMEPQKYIAKGAREEIIIINLYNTVFTNRGSNIQCKFLIVGQGTTSLFVSALIGRGRFGHGSVYFATRS